MRSHRRHARVQALALNTPAIVEIASEVSDFASAEIGSFDAFTIAVTFNHNINADNYATGVTIKANGASQAITTAIRQDNHSVVYYIIPPTWYGLGGALTWEYNSAVGNIKNENSNIPVITISSRTVVNNVTFDNFAGSGTIVQAGNVITGTGTAFLTQLQVGDTIESAGGAIDGIVTSITNNLIAIINTAATVVIGVVYTITRPS